MNWNLICSVKAYNFKTCEYGKNFTFFRFPYQKRLNG